jgi:hypothetical protein
VQNVEKVVEFLCDHLSKKLESLYYGSMKCFYRIYWHIKNENVDRVSLLFKCDPIKGTMKIHLICVFNKKKPYYNCLLRI